MKRFVVVFASVFAFVGAAGCSTPPAGELQPSDFAEGQTFEVASAEPFVRIDLPDEVFSATAWPDLRDLRAFNAAGEAVPFARMLPEATTAAGKRIALRSFRIAQANPGGVPKVELDAGTGSLQMRVIPGASAEVRGEYLMATTEADANVRLERLLLNWSDSSQNWQQKVTVAVSQDLQTWTTVAFRRPIMDLRTTDGERLTHREVVLESMGYSGRYWRVNFDSGFAPTLTSVEGELVPDVLPAPGVGLTARAQPQSDGSVVYSLDALQPIVRLKLMPSDVNSVLPVRIEGRREDKDKWELLTAAVVYRLNSDGREQVSDPVRIHGGSYRAFRVKPFGTTFGATPPTLVAERDGLVLVVNTRGAGPFLLAWGSRAATDSSVDASILVPGGRDAIASLPMANMGGRRQLGGVDRLTALAPGERAAQWQVILVWVALIGGAASLAFLALRLLKETRQA